MIYCEVLSTILEEMGTSELLVFQRRETSLPEAGSQGNVTSTGGFRQVEMGVERAASQAKVGNGRGRGAEAGK